MSAPLPGGPGIAARMSRRTFMKVAGLGALGTGLGVAAVKAITSYHAAAPISQRALVVVELAGGNDGLSMLVPYGDPLYRQLRKHTAIAPHTVLRLDHRVGLHPGLERLHRRGLAVVQGVGVPQPDLSHFEMMRRWWAGDSGARGSDATGFLGRLCDAIGDAGAPAVGISLGNGPTPGLLSRKVVTASLPSDGSGLLTSDDPDLQTAWLAGYRAMAHPDRADSTLLPVARKGARQALRLAEVLEKLPAATAYPESDLAAQLSLAARLLAAKVGVRVIHVPVGGDFDTHENHLPRYEALMKELDLGVDAFLADLAHRGLGQSVVVMTTSEFGRRPSDNGSAGLDHGAASVALLAGAVHPGLYGQYPSLKHLDADDNLAASVRLEEYYATIAEGWLGVPAREVLPGSPRPLHGPFR